jgi:pimeloyl-ACP methyl ester carboxylesterase
MDDYNETPVQFGPDGSLIGIITTPGDGPMAPVACLLMNMGAIHRIGPRRANVKLARQMAARGISSIRVDLAGLGDSRPASETADFRTQAVLDVQAAMNLVGTMLGVHRFVLIGLCSGAHNGLSVAVADPRLVGLLMFDGPNFPGRRARWERSLRRALANPRPGAFLDRVVGVIQRKLWPQQHQQLPNGTQNIFDSTGPRDSADYFCRSMNQLAERGVATMMFFTGSVQAKDRRRDLLGPFGKEPFARQLEYRFVPEIDHGLTSQASQQAFISLVCDWTLRVIHGDGSAPAQPVAAGGLAARGTPPSAPLAAKLEHAGS